MTGMPLSALELALVESGADELMLLTPAYDAARARSCELVVKGLAGADAGRHAVVS